jgi:hypothetical protein
MTVDFVIHCSLVRLGRPRYPVFVHRAAGLLHASFRPHLAVTPLRFANPSPPSGWVSRDRGMARATLGQGLAVSVSAFPLSELSIMLGTQ